MGAAYTWLLGDLEARVREIHPVEIHKSPSPLTDLEIQLVNQPCALK